MTGCGAGTVLEGDGGADDGSPDAVADDGGRDAGEVPSDASDAACESQCVLIDPPRTRICGPDGCGGSCGACPAGTTCLDGFWCRDIVGCGERCEDRVAIPGGPVLLGCLPSRYTELDVERLCGAQPGVTPRLYEVTVDPFRIDRFEVTHRRYRRCVDAGVCPPPDEACEAEAAYSPRFGHPGDDEYPVRCVSRGTAATYCGWEGRRLPTDAEWTKAARGGCELRGDPAVCELLDDAPTYVWGDDHDVARLFTGTGSCRDPETGCRVSLWNGLSGQAGPAGSYPLDVSPYGVHDLAGNVREWVIDRGDPMIDPRTLCGSPCHNPVDDSADHPNDISRGASFSVVDFGPGRHTTFHRTFEDPESEAFGPTVGFRCAQDVE